MTARFNIQFTKSAAKDLQKLESQTKKTIQSAIDRIGVNPNLGKPLRKDLKGLYSYRVVSFRIIYQILNKQLTIVIISVGDRKNIYERVKRSILSLRQ